jgi:hypothetical protein
MATTLNVEAAERIMGRLKEVEERLQALAAKLREDAAQQKEEKADR